MTVLSQNQPPAPGARNRQGFTVNYMKFTAFLDYRFAVFFSVACCLILTPPKSQAADFDAQINAFEAQDAVNPPPADPVLFVGSSTIVGWTTVVSDFPHYPVMNRGFGGSQMSDVLYYFDRVVAAYRPALIVLYEGDNDVLSKTVDQIFADYTNFLGRVRTEMPGSDVAFISVKPSPSRVSYLEKMRELNTRIQTLCDGLHTRYIDTFTPMLDTNGQPRPELFNSDMLHLNSLGYALWKQVVGPQLNYWNLSRGQSLLVDFGATEQPTTFGPSPNDPLKFWNNVTATIGTSITGTLSNLMTDLNVPTPLNLAMVERFTGPNTSGSAESTLYPLNAARDSLFGNTEAWTGLSDMFPSFKLTNLDPVLKYYFSFFGSRAGSTDNRETVYTVQGAASASAALDAANNVSATATVPAMAPNQAGEITVSITPGPNNNNANHFTYLNVMKVVAAPPQTPIVFTRPPTNQETVAYTAARFMAEVSGARPYTIQWFRNGEPIPGASRLTYEVIVTPEMDQSVFTVSVSNLGYSAMSSAALLTVTLDTVSPVLVSATSETGEYVKITFNEPLAPDTVAVGNFTINNQPVTGAVLGTDPTTIILTPSVPLTGQFTVEVTQVKDLSANAVVGVVSISGSVASLEPRMYLIDFGGADALTSEATNTWNNLTTAVGSSATGVLPNLVSTQNKTSNISIRMVRRFNGNNANGTTASGIFPANATRDSLYGNTESFGGLSAVYPSFALTGCEASWRYDLTFYASRLSTSDNREAAYTVAGATTNVVVLNAANNVSQRVTVSGMVPSSAGEITVSLAPTPNNNNANHFTYLGVMQVKEQFPPKLLPPMIVDNEIQLQWIGTGMLQWAPTATGPWTAISPAPNSTHTEVILPEENRFYRLAFP